MNTKQHNLNHVERMFCASWLLGRPTERLVGRDYFGSCPGLVRRQAAGMFGTHGLSAVIPSIAISA